MPGAVGIASLLAATVLVLRRPEGANAERYKRVAVLAGLGFLCAWILSLGPYVELFGRRLITPVGIVQKHVPALRMIRAPGRFSVFVTLCRHASITCS